MSKETKKNNNRLKEIRLSKHVTQKELAEKLGVSSQAVAYYEQGKREPSIKAWEEIAAFFNVPTSYLIGVSDDINGFDEWANNTGYSIEQIKSEIKRLIDTERLKGDEPIQQQISRAVGSLDGWTMDTMEGVFNSLNFKLMDLKMEVQNAFVSNEPDKEKTIKAMVAHKPKIRPGMNIETLNEIEKVLDRARYDLAKIKY